MSWPVERKKVVSFGWEWGPITPADLRRYAPHPDPGKECRIRPRPMTVAIGYALRAGEILV